MTKIRIEANMVARTNNETNKKFISVAGVVQGMNKSVEFSLNDTAANPTQVSDIETLIGAFKAKRLMPVLELDGGVIDEKPIVVKATGTVPAHNKEWAKLPTHALRGNIVWDVVDAVALPPLPEGAPAPDAMSNAIGVLKRFS